jgi:hypothetical protein
MSQICCTSPHGGAWTCTSAPLHFHVTEPEQYTSTWWRWRCSGKALPLLCASMSMSSRSAWIQSNSRQLLTAPIEEAVVHQLAQHEPSGLWQTKMWLKSFSKQRKCRLRFVRKVAPLVHGHNSQLTKAHKPVNNWSCQACSTYSWHCLPGLIRYLPSVFWAVHCLWNGEVKQIWLLNLCHMSSTSTLPSPWIIGLKHKSTNEKKKIRHGIKSMAHFLFTWHNLLVRYRPDLLLVLGPCLFPMPCRAFAFQWTRLGGHVLGNAEPPLFFLLRNAQAPAANCSAGLLTFSAPLNRERAYQRKQTRPML